MAKPIIKKFKKSLFGYNPSLVDKEIDRINTEFEEDLSMLMEELKALERQRDEIKSKIEDVHEGIVSIKSVEPEIASILARAHLDASFEIYNSIRKFKLIEKERLQTINEYRARCGELDHEIERTMESVRLIASM